MTRLRLIAELAGHEDRVWQVSWDPSGNRLASCSGDKSARIWSPVAGAAFFAPPEQAPAVSAETPSMDVDHAAKEQQVPDADSIKTTRSWQCLDTIDNAHKRTVRSVAFEPTKGQSLATASFDGTTAIWDKEDDDAYECVATLEGHENEAKCVAWSPSGQLLATCGRDKSVWIWESNGEGDFDCISVLMEHTHDVKAVVWHPVEEILASFSYDDTIRLWKEDDDDWYSAATLTGHGSTVWGGAFSADGGFLASVSDDRTIRVWAKEANKSEGAQEDGFYYRPEISYKCIAVVPNAIHKRAIYSVSWSAPSRSTGTEPSNLGYLATGCGDNSLRIFEVTPGKDESSPLLDIKLVVERGNAHGLNDINCVKWNPVHPGWLATAGDDGVIRIWYLEQ